MLEVIIQDEVTCSCYVDILHYLSFSTGRAARCSAGNASAEESAAARGKQRPDGENEQLGAVRSG